MTEIGPVAVEGQSVSAAWDPPSAPATGAVFACAPGAGGNFQDRSMRAVASVLADRGVGVVRFNFVYRQEGRRYPDPMPRLTACVQAVAEQIRLQLSPTLLLVGGRSMGGRAASVAVAEGLAADGLLLLAYPLHPPGRPDRLRDGHLSRIRIPTLCFNGTRDSLCRRDLMETATAGLGPTWTMHWLEDADHGFHVPKRSGRTDSDVLEEVAESVAVWVSSLRASQSS